MAPTPSWEAQTKGQMGEGNQDQKGNRCQSPTKGLPTSRPRGPVLLLTWRLLPQPSRRCSAAAVSWVPCRSQPVVCSGGAVPQSKGWHWRGDCGRLVRVLLSALGAIALFLLIQYQKTPDHDGDGRRQPQVPNPALVPLLSSCPGTCPLPARRVPIARSAHAESEGSTQLADVLPPPVDYVSKVRNQCGLPCVSHRIQPESTQRIPIAEF